MKFVVDLVSGTFFAAKDARLVKLDDAEAFADLDDSERVSIAKANGKQVLNPYN